MKSHGFLILAVLIGGCSRSAPSTVQKGEVPLAVMVPMGSNITMVRSALLELLSSKTFTKKDRRYAGLFYTCSGPKEIRPNCVWFLVVVPAFIIGPVIAAIVCA